MALLDRISGQQKPKISPHALYGLMRELARAEIVKQDIIDNLVLEGDDLTDLDWLIAQYQLKTVALDKELWLQGMHGLLLISELRYAGYTTQAEIVAKITSL